MTRLGKTASWLILRNGRIVTLVRHSKLKVHCDEQITYNDKIQASIKSMAEACDEINTLKEMVSELQEQVANLQSQFPKPSIAGESTGIRKRGRTRRSSPMWRFPIGHWPIQFCFY